MQRNSFFFNLTTFFYQKKQNKSIIVQNRVFLKQNGQIYHPFLLKKYIKIAVSFFFSTFV